MKYVLAGIMVCCALTVYAQTGTGSQAPQRLSPDMAVDMAIKNNLNLESARLALDMKKRKSDLVWNQFLPTTGVNGTLSRSNYATTVQNTVVPIFGTGTSQTSNGVSGEVSPLFFAPYPMNLPQWNVMGGFSATLDLSFALVEGVRSLRLDYQAGQVSYEKAKLQIEQNVRKMYNQILLLEANVALLEENFSNTQRQAAIAEANFKAGLAPRLSWLQAQVAVENMRPAVNDLHNSLNTLKSNFALILGLPWDAPFELEPLASGVSYIPHDVAELISKAASGKPDIQELQAGIVTLQHQRKAMALQSYTPFLRLGWSISSMFSPTLDPFKNNWFNADNWNGGGNFYVTIGMNFNGLFSFTKEGQQRKDMDAGIQIQQINLAQMIRNTELEIFTKVNTLEMIRTTAEAQQSAVDLAGQSYKLTEEAYRAGLQDFQSVQSAALALEQAKLQLLTQQFSYLNNLIDLEYSTGVPFGTLSTVGK
ncbi:MAG: TolC family protein [Treponema sp.]|nr:TolC family protein [Treponema sp.]